MEVQWVGVEPPRLGPPHTAVGLIVSILFGNVYLSLYVIFFFFLLHHHFTPADVHIIFTSLFFKNFLKILLIIGYRKA